LLLGLATTWTPLCLSHRRRRIEEALRATRGATVYRIGEAG
jgi:hypothetical protein